MKNKLISVSIILVLIFTMIISVDAASPSPRVDLNDYELTVTDTSNVYVNGTVSIAKGQNIALFDSTGKIPLSYTTVKDTGSQSSFKIKVPAVFLKEGTNTFKVISLPVRGKLNASSPKTFNVKVNSSKKDQIITASDLTIKVNEKKKIGASVNSGLPLTYMPENQGIVTVDLNGTVVGRAEGRTRITISQAGNNEYKAVSKIINVTVTDPTGSTKKNQTISSIDSYQFADVKKSINLNAKASSGLKVTYKSTNAKIVSVDSNGKLTAKNPGTAKIQVSQAGNAQYKAVTKNITIKVPKRNSYDTAMKPMQEAALAQAKWMKNYSYNWDKWASGKDRYTIKKSKTCGSCVTYVACVCYRLGLLKDGSGNVVFCGPNGKPWKKDYPSKYFKTYYYKGGKSVKWLKKHDKLKKGDILMYAYGSNKAGGHGNHNYIFAGSYSGNKVKAWSNAYASSFKKSKKGKLEKVGKAITGVVRPKTYNINTSCTNGTITQSRLVLAAQKVVVEWHPNNGKKVTKIIVDGKDKTASYKNKKQITWNKLDCAHTVEVICN